MKRPATPVRLSKAQFRVLLYMVQNDVRLILGAWGTACTDDAFQWPVSGATVDRLLHGRLIEKDRRATENALLQVSPAGVGAIKEQLKRALAAEARAALGAGATPTPLEELIARACANG